MSMLTIRAQAYEDGWVAFVELNGKEMAFLANGFITERDALRAADKKRKEMDADFEVIKRRAAYAREVKA
jgi:hypothetical protein